MPTLTAGEVAERLNLEIRGDADYPLEGVCSLGNGLPNHLGFLGEKRYVDLLAETRAGALILKAQDADSFSGVCLIAENPQLEFARAAGLFDQAEQAAPGIHASASVHAEAVIDPTASIGPQVAIGASAVIGAGAVIGPGAVIGDHVLIGSEARIAANVTIIGRSRLGTRVSVLPGAVIGSRGFGLVPDENRNWVEIPQLGSVEIGDDVEIGACTTIDRGAIDDTVIEAGCKLDDHVHIAHNCRIGNKTVIAGWTAVAGSTRIGAGCMIAGGVGIADNLRICDGVMVTGMTMVSGNIDKPGVYSSGWGAIPRRQWVRVAKASRDLPEMEKRLKRLESRLGLDDAAQESDET